MAKKVTFTLSSDVVAGATAGLLLGEFNNWNVDNGVSLKKQKDGSMKTSVTLEAGKSYQYRYLLNDGRWVNDNSAANYAYAHGYEVENCVIAVPEEAEKVVKAKVSKEAKPATEKAPKAAKVKAVKEKTEKAPAKKAAKDKAPATK